MAERRSCSPSCLPAGAAVPGAESAKKLAHCAACAACVVAVVALALIASLPLIAWVPDIARHDQQRVGQVLTMTLAWIAAILVMASGRARSAVLLGFSSRNLLALVIAAAMVSASLARQPMWAFTEVALGVASLGLAWIAAMLRRCSGVTADRVLLATLAFTCAGLMAQFVVAYLAAVVNDEGVLNGWLLLDGFSNPRFYGQFLTLALPMLMAPLLARGGLHRYAWMSGFLAVLVWTAAITSGTRGTWLGLACAVVVLACIGPAGRRWAALQVSVFGVGVLVYWFAFTMVPDVLGTVVAFHAASKLSTSLSGREIIWGQAIEVALRHPLLGIGPMQLADLPNGVAAHPHQAWLQWAAELGLPSALLVSALVVYSAYRLISSLRKVVAWRHEQPVLRLCLTGSMVAGLAQAMVDGVLVMPYSQLWLAVLAGWLAGLQSQAVSHASVAPTARALSWQWLTLLSAAVAMLGFIVIRDYPNLKQREEIFAHTFGGHAQPRFWAQGLIANRRLDEVR